MDLAEHKKRSKKTWTDRATWETLYNDAYDYAIPYRRPAEGLAAGDSRVERLFDATAIESAFRSAAQLHADLFPPGFWKLSPGAVTRAAVKLGRYSKEQAAADQQQLEAITDIASAFFESGEFDASSSEMCIDLMAGTGALFPLEGDDIQPVRWVCIPIDELAIETDAYGGVAAIYWKQQLTRRQVAASFPKGRFPKDWTKKLEAAADEKCEVCQDFVRDPETTRWNFYAYLRDSEFPIAETSYRTQPMAVPRYHRVPGEPYGRGPILLALPTIKTLNKAVELTLKSAAIQMLGLWGYRPGGSFNPDTVRLGPGEFWPMQSTGGVLGPDVTRLDPAAGRIDVSQLITQELRDQVRAMLNDDRLPEQGGTPVSATEIMARLKRISQNWLGAYGRLVNEIVPVIVRRVLEILYNKKILPAKVDVDMLLVKVDVLSPIAMAVKAAAHQQIIEFIQLVIAVKGDPRAAELIVKVDDALRTIGNDMVPASFVRTEAEQRQLEQQLAAAAAQIAAAQQQQGQAA